MFNTWKREVETEKVYIPSQGKEDNRAYLCIPHLCKQEYRNDKLKTGKTDAQKEKAEKLRGWGQAEKGAGDTPLRIIFTRFWLLEPC